jgi:hypothetical protein
MDNQLPPFTKAIIFVFGSMMYSIAFCRKQNDEGNPSLISQPNPTNITPVVTEDIPTAIAVPIIMCKKSTKPFSEQMHDENSEQQNMASIEDKTVSYNKSAVRHAETLVVKTVSTKQTIKLEDDMQKQEPDLPNNPYDGILREYARLFC